METGIGCMQDGPTPANTWGICPGECRPHAEKRFEQHDDTLHENATMLSLYSNTQTFSHELTTLITKGMNDRLFTLFGQILHLERWHLTMSSHCSHLL
jgi:hypothetical protein